MSQYHPGVSKGTGDSSDSHSMDHNVAIVSRYQHVRKLRVTSVCPHECQTQTGASGELRLYKKVRVDLLPHDQDTKDAYLDQNSIQNPAVYVESQ